MGEATFSCMVRPELGDKVRQSSSNLAQSKLTHALYLIVPGSPLQVSIVNYSMFIKLKPAVDDSVM